LSTPLAVITEQIYHG